VASYSTNEFKPGLKVMLGDEPCAILGAEFVKPGKGQAFTRVKLRYLRTGRVIERNFRSGESIPAADVVDREMDYLYKTGEDWVFMDAETYEQYEAGGEAMGGCQKWLAEQSRCRVTLFNGAPLTVTPPNFVELKVAQSDPGMKGDTATGGVKPATLETGAVVRVPLFVEEGAVIKVDTRTGEYMGRA